MPEVWDIWFAEFEFEETRESKDRPVLVVDIQEGTVFVSAMITSKGPRDEFCDVDITKWKTAGLDKFSTIRGSRVLPLPLSVFRRKIGKLDPEDIAAYLKKNY